MLDVFINNVQSSFHHKLEGAFEVGASVLLSKLTRCTFEPLIILPHNKDVMAEVSINNIY